MKLNELSDKPGARTRRQRVGRGIGSGRGKTAGRGHKGQKSRSGVALKGFEGGQMPIHRRVPKRGFNNPMRKRFHAVNLGRLQQAVDAGRLDPKQAVTIDALSGAGVLKKARDGVRLLAKGELKSKLTIEVSGASKAAVAAVEAAGGVVLITTPKAGTKQPTKRAKTAQAGEAAAERGETGSVEDAAKSGNGRGSDDA